MPASLVVRLVDETEALALNRISDRLLASKREFEAALFERVQDLFGFAITVSFHDLTNTKFEGEMAAHAKAQCGHWPPRRDQTRPRLQRHPSRCTHSLSKKTPTACKTEIMVLQR
jgi:hypothetical protein